LQRERDWDQLSRLSRAAGDEPGTYEIDDRTWSDLGLNGVFDVVDRTLTPTGEQVLYARLRRPTTTGESFSARARVVDALRADPAALTAVRKQLRALGTADGDAVVDLLWRERTDLPVAMWPCRLGALLAVAMVGVTAFVSVFAGAVGLVATMLLNLWLHGRVRLGSQGDLPSLRYLARLMRTAKRLCKMGLPGPERESFVRLATQTWSLRRKLSVQRLLNLNLVDELIGTLNVLFLLEAQTYASAHREIVKLRPLLREAFKAVGALDEAQSRLTLHEEQPTWTRPALREERGPLAVVDLVHPSLDQPVPNSVTLDKGGLVVTGSNMSGKSTFLRAVGIGAVLAQAIALVPAASYSAQFVRVCAVMTAADDLTERKSYYLDEALAVLRAVGAAGGDPPTLTILDELFRGTNSAERVAAGVAVVRWVASQGMVVVATHDMETADLLDGRLANAHFQDRIQDDDILFDYRLHPGRAQRTNALDILALLGYPAGIVEDARAIVRPSLVARS